MSPISLNATKAQFCQISIDALGKVAEKFEVSVNLAVVHLRDWSRGPGFKSVLFWTDVKVEYEFSSAAVPKFEAFIGTV